MRRALLTLIVVGLVCSFAKLTGARKPTDVPGGYNPRSVVTTNGLYLALPTYLQKFPVEVMPEP